MKGMTLDQYKEIVKFVHRNHKFGQYRTAIRRVAIRQIYPNIDAHGLNIKYIESVYDSRTDTIWSITFRGMGREVQFRTNTFVGSTPPENFNYDNLYDWCMDFLKGEYKVTEEFLTKR